MILINIARYYYKSLNAFVLTNCFKKNIDTNKKFRL